MSRDTQALLEAFEHLPAEEKRAFTEEVLRRSMPFDSAPLEDEEIGGASAALFESLEEKDADPKARLTIACLTAKTLRLETSSERSELDGRPW